MGPQPSLGMTTWRILQQIGYALNMARGVNEASTWEKPRLPEVHRDTVSQNTQCRGITSSLYRQVYRELQAACACECACNAECDLIADVALQPA